MSINPPTGIRNASITIASTKPMAVFIRKMIAICNEFSKKSGPIINDIWSRDRNVPAMNDSCGLL